MVTIRKQEQHSVQEFEPPDSIGYNTIWFNEVTRIGTLPAWGAHGRDRELRELYRNPYNWIGQAAVAAVIRKVKSTPWQIKAGRNTVGYFQDLLQQAQFSKGWGEFISRLLLDFLTADYGAYIEIIGRGDPAGPIKGRAMGLAALDTLRCVPTGNLTYPVVYYSRRTNKLHKLHYTRVCRIVDMPDGDESRHMAGLSSMSRAASMIEQQIPLNQYIAGTFENLPPIGIFYNNANMTEAQWKPAWQAYLAKLKQGATGMMTLNNGEANTTISGEFLRFATTPDGFDYEKYTEIAVNAYAAAFGIDRQDIYPLTGKVAGTATQSEILHEKARGMAFGDILSTLERAINNFILPANAEFSFEYRDEEKDIEIATRDDMLMNISQKMFSQGIPNDAILRYLAQMSETFRDVLTDENGELIELPDNDKKPVDEIPEVDDIVVDDNLDETGEDAAIGDDSDNKQTDIKTIQSTRLDFENRFDDFLDDARAGLMDRRRANTILRGMLRTFGNRAFRDGLDDGGVDSTQMDNRDETTIKSILFEQTQYVSNLTDVIFNGNGVTDAMAAQKAAMWFNKSIRPFYDAGLKSADQNGMYEFVLGNTELHCSTCKLLNGQVHRLKNYLDSGWYPQSDQLECGGWHCDCRLVKSKRKASGRLPRSLPRVA